LLSVRALSDVALTALVGEASRDRVGTRLLLRRRIQP
jgi:hypothetical protein